MQTLLRLLFVLTALVVVAVVYVWLDFDRVRYNTIRWANTPSKPIDALPEPLAFNYAREEAWAALPTRRDAADEVVDGDADMQPTATVDVFFVYGTTYGRLYKESWNQPADDAETNSFTDRAMRMASAFNICCKIYAPRFRQAGLGAFGDSTSSGRRNSARRHSPSRFPRRQVAIRPMSR